jgi:hypothetical protein
VLPFTTADCVMIAENWASTWVLHNNAPVFLSTATTQPPACAAGVVGVANLPP